jgi:Holliday junction resolvase
LTTKSITNVRLEQEKFNQIIGFAREFIAESYTWLILIQQDQIKLGPFLIKKSQNHWILEHKHAQSLKFSTRSAALAYCVFYKRQKYYLADRTAELDEKLEILEAEIQSCVLAIKQAKKKAKFWRADLCLARYLQKLAEYQKVKTELKKNIQQAKYMKI